MKDCLILFGVPIKLDNVTYSCKRWEVDDTVADLETGPLYGLAHVMRDGRLVEVLVLPRGQDGDIGPLAPVTIPGAGQTVDGDDVAR